MPEIHDSSAPVTDKIPEIHDSFDPVTVALDKRNLIEASAGTGKTYSIAIIALRLIVEKEIPLKSILMVTFTRFAVAELELRIRSFVRMAMKASRGETIDDKTIAGLVQSQIECHGKDKVRRSLEAASLSLDDTSIMTIHSFCHLVLKEFAFETGQVFGSEITDKEMESDWIDRYFRDFWRKHVTTLPVDVLKDFEEAGFGYRKLLGIIQKSMGGMVPIFTADQKGKSAGEIGLLNRKMEEYRQVVSSIASQRDALVETIRKDVEKYKALVGAGKERSSHYLALLENQDWAGLGEKIVKAWDKRYTMPSFEDLGDRIQELGVEVRKKGSLIDDMRELICWGAYRHVCDSLEKRKSLEGNVTYDDMLTRVADALTRGERSKSLIEGVRKKYPAVAVDEYQDTDKVQSRIFETLFGHEKGILFYIGDPKQSIYAFRKADIATYLSTAARVDRVYRMNVNFRSTAAYIEAMNGFFRPTPGFDTFAYAGRTPSIEYIEVQSPVPNPRGRMTYKGESGEGIFVSRHEGDDEIWEGVLQILRGLLFSGHYTIDDGKGAQRPIKPSDIGILVRARHEGSAIKKLLARHRIPAVTIDDSKVFGTREAKDLLYILTAAYEPSRSNINRALLTSIAGYDIDRILSSDGDALVERFRLYQETWKQEGVYVMMRRFMADHDVEELLFRGDAGGKSSRKRRPENAERVLSNILQLTELLHSESKRRNYDMREQIQWLGKGIDGEARSGDEYLQRIESDEDAVEIITIHKSKGLEYKVVIAPHLDMTATSRHETLNFRDDTTGEYYIAYNKSMSNEAKEMALTQTDQENRRLLYVAVTRACYACFITAEEQPVEVKKEAEVVEKPGGKAKKPKKEKTEEVPKTTLGVFLRALDSLASAPPHVALDWKIPEDFQKAVQKPPQAVDRQYAEAKSFDVNLTEKSWRKASYTYLNPEHETVPLARRPVEGGAYDEFVFNGIRRGAHTGNLLHYIFERIDFTRDDNRAAIVDRAIKRLSASQPVGFTDRMSEMIAHLTRVDLVPGKGVSLEKVSWQDRVNELEFDFPLSLFRMDELLKLSSAETPFRLVSDDQLEGIMNGKIDLLFRQDGRYYILDWKSNHLGYSLADYGPEGVAAAMRENNYHLQYLIYTVAVRRYLAKRVPNFDFERDFGGVIYLFVRGVRAGQDTGVFFTKPSLALVQGIEGTMAKPMSQIRLADQR